ncbi:hypothetical protein CFOL_v3_25271 [Cephalotus follicularis]|uniref:Uncharacterized protein n=1 Tax=Cephalotus follicularis TaxID=3775 RepID=A0A1Q3CP30_CEPFO|nr:hypothetical protein CFOL_v3_25271 [Cephalotus follicularis]
MEDCMRQSMRKLAIWYTKTFTPIMTHDELDPIMATLGFTGLQPVTEKGGGKPWKEYVYPAAAASKLDTSQALPRLRLPYPLIDGLHLYTYRAFLDALNFYLHTWDISHLFHIRGMPLQRTNDRSRKWRRMEEDDSTVFVYREGTLDQSTYSLYHSNKPGSNGGHDSDVIRDQGNNTPSSCLVQMKDINPMADFTASSSP